MAKIILEANHCWIDTSPQNLAKNYGKFGVYILGIKNSQGRIVPYYVGQTGMGKTKTLSIRVLEHICAVTSPYTTYTIFSEDFLRNKRGTNADFISRIKLPSTKYPNTAFKNDILYLNNGRFFNDAKILGASLWPNQKESSNLSELNKYPITLPLFNSAIKSQKNIFKPGSLYFTPILIKQKSMDEIGGITTAILNLIEAYVKFSLIVNTIGKSNKYESLHSYLMSNQIFLNINCPVIQKEFHAGPVK